MKYYSGIDLHSDNCYITTIDSQGVVCKEQRVPNSELRITLYFRSLPGEHVAVVESTTGWYWLNDLLESLGIELVLAHAKYLKAISYAKVKTDKVDSHTLAILLWQNLIPRAHKISRELRDFRDTMRARLRIVQQRTMCLTRRHGIEMKFNHADSLTEQFQLQDSLLEEQSQFFENQILTLEKSLHPTLIHNDDVQRMLYIPGIGKLTAFTIYLEIDGIERFPSEKQFFSYCRLVPSAKNSNKHAQQRSSKDGNKYLKIAFSDASVHAIQYYPEIRGFYNKLLHRTNEPVARTIIAKELAKIVYYVLKNKTPYRGFKGLPISHQKSVQWPRLKSPNA
jgi:transposase